jgi:hypothetical protein
MSGYAELMSAIDAFDIEGYLTDKGFHALKTDEWVGDCPHCGKTDKCAVNTEKKTFHCWVCQQYEDQWDDHAGYMRRRPASGAGGLLKLIEWLEGIDANEAIQMVLDANGIHLEEALPELDLKALAAAANSGRPAVIAAPEGARPILSPLPYMLKRGITMEDVRTFGLFWCAEGRYRNRLVFPVWEDGFLVYWQARAMYEQSESQGRFIKALNPARSPGAAVSSDVLMNLDTACSYHRVAIVEGPMDVVRAGPSAVCTFGKQIHPRQIRRLVEKGVRAVDLMWDGPTPSEPDGAHPEMMQVAPTLAAHFDLRLVFLPQGDPGDWDRASLDAFRASALPFHALNPMAIPGVLR